MPRLLITVTGPSGTGKDAVIGQLLGQVPNLKRYTTATTRAPRQGEVDGQHYHFLSREDFLQRLEHGAFLEHNANYHGNLYGTLRADVEAIWAGGNDGISDINIHGVRAFRESIPIAHFAVLLLPPSRDRLEARLTKRNPLMAEQGRVRLVAMEPDFPHLHDPHYVFTNPDMVGSRLTDYDAVLVNDDLEVTTYAVAERIMAERVARGII